MTFSLPRTRVPRWRADLHPPSASRPSNLPSVKHPRVLLSRVLLREQILPWLNWNNN